MIYIPLSFYQMWVIMLAGVLTVMLAKINNINQNSPDEIMWWDILKKFFRKEWASYGMSAIITAIIAYSFVYMKQFQKIDNAEITKWAKWIPLGVLILYLLGCLNLWIFYRVMGRIQSKGDIDLNILKEKPKQ